VVLENSDQRPVGIDLHDSSAQYPQDLLPHSVHQGNAAENNIRHSGEFSFTDDN
jgi:hypothetical protein